MTLHEHGLHVVFLGNLIFRQDRRIEPACERDAGRLHDLLVVETADQIVVIDFPDARPVLPGTFGEAVVEGQGHDIEADVGRALHVVVAAEDVGAHAGAADVAGEQQQHAACAHVGGADRVLGLAHGPDQCRWLLCREHLGDALELRAGNAGDALDLLRIPLLHFLARVLEAVHALPDELLVLPAVLDDVPHDPVQHRNVGAWPHAHIFGRVGSSPCQSRIDDDDVRLFHLGAFEQVLQRHRMGLGRVAAHDHLRFGVADVGVAVRHRAVAPGIGHAGDGGRMADARLMVRVVGAPEGAKLAEQVRAFVGALGRTEPIDGIAA